MFRRRGVLWIAAVALLAGCASSPSGPRPAGWELDAMRKQAHDLLGLYDKAALDAARSARLVPVGALTGQLGDWKTANADQQRAFASGRVVAAATLPDSPKATGQVVWDDGSTDTVSLISAGDALEQLVAAGSGDCPQCTPLEVTKAYVTTARIQTTRGPARVPAWGYVLKGTAARVTRVAFSGSAAVRFTSPSWDSIVGPSSIESATIATSSRQVTAVFTGSPGPASRVCGADYTAEAVESANAIVVIIIEHRHADPDGMSCTAIGARRTAIVDLTQPLGGRPLLDMRGTAVPVTIAA